MKQVYLLLTFVLLPPLLFAQNAQYSQYIFNSLVINPAYTGAKGVLSANGFYRKQWSGLPGAPTSQSVTVDGRPGADNEKYGLGLQVLNDQTGAQSKTSIFGSYAYWMKLGTQARLSFGLAAGAVAYSTDGTKLNTDIPNDPSVPTSKETTWIPDAQVGSYFHTNRFYAGISATGILTNIKYASNSQIVSAQQYYYTAGYVFDIGQSLKLKPSILIKDDLKAPSNVDFNLFALFYDRFWIGGSWRTTAGILHKTASGDFIEGRNAAAVIVEYYVTDRLRIGYAYDITMSALSDFGTHEISIGYYHFRKKEPKMISPRYF